MNPSAELLDRATGSLWGLAIGDALGMPTQLLSRREILRTYGEITGFEAPSASHPIAARLEAGAVTDDTEQAVLLGELLQPDAHLDQGSWERPCSPGRVGCERRARWTCSAPPLRLH